MFDRVDLPEDIARHVRYPQDLFQFQSDKYLKYHMESPRDFYNLEDVWNVPEEKFGQEGDLQTVKPYYVIMKIPGENREEFVLLLPFTRNDPPIMAGWLAARNDGVNYGSLIAFTFPLIKNLAKGRVKYPGPQPMSAPLSLGVRGQWLNTRNGSNVCRRSGLSKRSIELGISGWPESVDIEI